MIQNVALRLANNYDLRITLTFEFIKDRRLFDPIPKKLTENQDFNSLLQYDVNVKFLAKNQFSGSTLKDTTREFGDHVKVEVADHGSRFHSQLK